MKEYRLIVGLRLLVNTSTMYFTASATGATLYRTAIQSTPTLMLNLQQQSMFLELSLTQGYSGRIFNLDVCFLDESIMAVLRKNILP